MTNDLDWLDDIILIAEGETEETAADINIFRSEGEVCRYLEHWWVEEKHGFAFSASGDRIELGIDAGMVVVRSRAPCNEGTVIVLSWLQHLADAVANARMIKAAKGHVILGHFEKSGISPKSIEGLIAYTGFTE